jgi:hypothetical protein
LGALHIVGKPSMSRFNECDLKKIKPKMQEILNFE